MKKAICILLTVLMLLPLASCGKTGTEQVSTSDKSTAPVVTEDTQVITTEPADPATVPEFARETYSGYTYRIADAMHGDTKYTTDTLITHEQIGEVLEDAIYTRTVEIEELFDIRLEDIPLTNTQFLNACQAGEDAYDMHNATMSNVMSVVNRGVIMDLTQVDGICLDKAWWDQNANFKLSFNDHLYFTFSDFTIAGMDNGRAVYFNKDMLDDLNIENYRTADLYRLVDEGTWTWDILAELTKDAVADLNGDGVIGPMDRNGVVDSSTTFYEALITSCNAEMFKQGDDGVPYFFCFDYQEQFVNVYTTLLSTFNSDNRFLVMDSGMEDVFTGGRSLFYVSSLAGACRLRKTDLNFGILPCPKWDIYQEEYYNVSPNGHTIMIPNTIQNMDRSANILEAMTYYSSSYHSENAVMPSYFEVMLTTRSSRDSESAHSLQIIHDSICYTIKLISATPGNIYTHLSNKNMNIASVLKAEATAQRKKLAKVLEELG